MRTRRRRKKTRMMSAEHLDDGENENV
jgi:hypothetical protein